MTNIQVLKIEIDSDPLTRGYAGMPDAEVAADINTAYRDVAAFVTVDDVRQYLITQIDGSGASQRSSLDMVREYAEDGTVRGGSAGETAPAARRSGCQMIWYMLQREESSAVFPVSDTNVNAQFIAIGPDGSDGPSILSGVQLNTIAVMATETVSRGVELDLGTVKVGHVEQARSI